MLNGVAPLLVFTFSPIPTNPLFNALTGVPVVSDIISAIGVPIPLYFDEQVTGLYVDSESKALDLEVEVKTRKDAGPPIVKQNGIDSTVTVNMFAKKDSILLSVLLALNDLVFTKAASSSYQVSYFNGSTVLIGGFVKSMVTNMGTDDDLIRISFTLSKANWRASTKNAATIDTIAPITGALPGAA